MRYRTLEERLLFNSWVDPVTGCWEWLGRLSRNGRARINIRAGQEHVTLYAYRVAVVVFTGRAIPEDHHVDHKCHNTRCINPAHLQTLPIEDNCGYYARRENRLLEARA